MVNEIVIVSAARTPIGSFCGGLSTMKSHDLGSVVIKEVLNRAKVDPSDVSEVIFGQVLLAGEGQNPARQAAVKAGIPYDVPAYLVNMLCASGLRAILSGYQAIRTGEASVVVCGGQESMSGAPHYTHLRTTTRLGNASLIDYLVTDGLTDAFHNIHMGETAENLAKQYSISREEQDKYSVESHNRAVKAQTQNFFKNEIVPVKVVTRKEDKLITQDECPVPATSLAGLARLKPAFVKDGTVTAGNASSINDGAAAVLLMTEEVAKQRGLKPLCRIVGVSQAGCDPKTMGYGPVPAVKLLLQKVGWSKDDVDLFELNEAFASQALTCVRELGLDPAKVNVNGGAIALGHPIGCSGTRVVVTLIHAMQRTGSKRGIASLCAGGGMGIAIAIQAD